MAKRTKKPVSKRPRADKARNQAAFLAAFAETGIVVAACREAGIDVSRVSRWRKTDDDFGERFATAFETACGHIEAEIRRRGEFGVDEPVFQGGKQVGVKRKYSDLLLIARARACMPDRYRDRSDVDITSGGKPLSLFDAIGKIKGPRR